MAAMYSMCSELNYEVGFAFTSRFLSLQMPPQPMFAPGVGDLPMPMFSCESAGVAGNGMLDFSAPALDTHERSEKKLRERDTKLKNPRMTVDTNASKDDQVN